MMPKDRMLVKGNEMVTGTCPLDCDHVDSSLEGQGELFPADDVDATDRFIPHPAWSLFDDHIQKEN